MNFSKTIKRIAQSVLVVALLLVASVSPAYAKEGEAGMTVSPMYQFKVLTPGSVEPGSFVISNPVSNTEPVAYDLSIRAFSYDDEKGEVLEESEGHAEIVDWITIEGEHNGTLAPNEHREVAFTINVPENAPTGGQYAAIIVHAGAGQVGPIVENIEVAHLIYAEVSGETVHDGKINSVNVPSFLFSGNITGSSTIYNNGNSHSYATHILKVYPLFGGEEFYTNEEDPQTNLIMPGATRYTSIAWNETPSIGIFRVVYTIDYEGKNMEVSKVVIVCPLWLLIIIALLVIVLLFRIFKGGRKNR